MDELLDILDKLEDAGIPYVLRNDRRRGLRLVAIRPNASQYEVEFSLDGKCSVHEYKADSRLLRLAVTRRLPGDDLCQDVYSLIDGVLSQGEETLFALLRRLDDSGIAYLLQHNRCDRVLVYILAGDDRWLVEFFPDGHTEIDLFSEAPATEAESALDCLLDVSSGQEPTPGST